MTKDLCRETYAKRSVGAGHAVPGAHAETEQMSTGRTHERGVRVQRWSRVCRGKAATAAGGREREQFCGGEKEWKEPA